jgi:CIC family chloride channel protein
VRDSTSNEDAVVSEEGGRAAVPFEQDENKILLILTLVIGAVVGMVVVAFMLVTENLGRRLYPAGGASWRRLAMPVFGSLVSGYFLARYFPYARGSGIPQTKTALFLHDGYIRFRTVIGKFSMCSLTLASGIALGREGPSVQVAAGIASVLGRRLGLSPKSVRALVPIGAAAALAAAFNTPIAAVLFTLEEVMGDMHAPVLGSIVLSSATSWMVLHLLLGDEPLFHVPPYQLVHPVEFVFYALLGLVGGLVSVAFVRLLLWQRKHFLKMPKATLPFQPLAGGLLVGAMGWFVPQVLGVGYGYVDEALNGRMLIGIMALLVVLKLVACATCYASGNAGGIFGPSLFIGAMLGGAVGGVAHQIFPDYTASAGAYALVGMGAAFAGIVRVPLTSVIMIFEITRDYTIIVPLMIANLVSYFISSRLQEESIYEALLHQDGIRLPGGARARETLMTVANAFRPEEQALPASELAARATAEVDWGRGAWPVENESGLCGMVTAAQLDEAVGSEPLAALVPDPGPAEELTEEKFPHVHSDQPLEVALQRLAQSGLPVLPVVSRTNIRELKGTVSLRDVMGAYALGRPAPLPSPGARRTRHRGFAGTLVVLSALVLLAGWLQFVFRAERADRGGRYAAEGYRLMGTARYDEAADQFRKAVSITHSAGDRLALGTALLDGDHLVEAAIYLNGALEANPHSGPANLAMAHLAAREGWIGEAVTYYQHAIYGAWPGGGPEGAWKARMELADALGGAGMKEQARAELLSALAAAASDAQRKRQAARLLLDDGFAADAVGAFRELRSREPHNPAVSDGLADAEFGAGNYPAARVAYRASLVLAPDDTGARQRLAECDQILALDPTLPRLAAVARYTRGRQLLTAILEELHQCGGSSADTEAVRDRLARQRPASYADAAEANLAEAEQLWQARAPACAAANADGAVSLIMKKLSRR